MRLYRPVRHWDGPFRGAKGRPLARPFEFPLSKLRLGCPKHDSGQGRVEGDVGFVLPTVDAEGV